MVSEYVLSFAHQHPHAISQDVLLIKKQKPAWQAGHYNLPGGKLEAGETPVEAAIRELGEETGIHACPRMSRKLGTLEGPGFIVHCVFCQFYSWFDGRIQEIVPGLTDERVFWMDTWGAINNTKLIPNLRIIIPLMTWQLEGWRVIAERDFTIEHEWSVVLRDREKVQLPPTEEFYARAMARSAEIKAGVEIE